MFEDALIAWDEDDNPEGNVAHLLEHGVSMEEFEAILTSDDSGRGRSRSSGRHTAWGETAEGRSLVIVFEIESRDPLVVRPITAFDSED